MFGIVVILIGRIDKTGKIITQVIENYMASNESDIFAAIAKQIIYFKSDITTSMGFFVLIMLCIQT